MKKEQPAATRDLKTVQLQCDLAVIGGGMAGVCCAITAAREGLKVVLIQDRSVLGGNASSEVRLWVLGATAHMSNNNRWAREGGVIDEILVENVWRNPDGNALIMDTVVLEKVVAEPNITLLLNTAVFEATKSSDARISAARAFCSQNSTMYTVSAPLFCDASGDGVLGFLAGAAFRMGAEAADEFGEKFAPSSEYGELLGHSMYFYSKDVGHPVRYTAPSFALSDITKIPRYRSFNAKTDGCRLWWIEYGGRLDTVHDTEEIKWELWKVVYGVWDYIKNSGSFPDAENLTLEWVGTIPGKRESRRFEGAYMLTQQDIVEQRLHPDAVSFGGWSIDLHPADGIFSERPGCNQWHSRGVYQIPYRCLYSRNVENLFLAGRIISASHVAFGSSRVMATCASAAQAVGMAAAICFRDRLLPADISNENRFVELRRRLIGAGQFIPDVRLEDPDDLVQKASISASGSFELSSLEPNGPTVALDRSRAQMIPLPAGRVPEMTFFADVRDNTQLRVELRTSYRHGNFSPDVVLEAATVELEVGEGMPLRLRFDTTLQEGAYVFVCFMANENVSLRCTLTRVTGVLSCVQRRTQAPEQDIGIEAFELWTPDRRPSGHNLALMMDPPVDVFGPANVANGLARPTTRPNAWVVSAGDRSPSLTLRWQRAVTIGRVELSFDTDFDHPMESVLHGHPESAMPLCVKQFRLKDGSGRVVAEVTDNHQTRRSVRLEVPVTTDALVLEVGETHGALPAAVFGLRCYEA